MVQRFGGWVVLALLIGFSVGAVLSNTGLFRESVPSPETSTDISSLNPITSGWVKYHDPALGITFQYPCGWTVKDANNNLVSLTPPWASSEPWSESDEGVPAPQFAIHIAPLNAYTIYPATISKEEIDTGLAGLNNVPYKIISLKTASTKIVLLYDIASDQNGAIAFIDAGGSQYQAEMARFSSGLHKTDDWMALFNVLLSLNNIPTAQATTTRDQSCPR